MSLESMNISHEDPYTHGGFFAKSDPPPNGTNESGGSAPEESDPPPNGSSDPPPNGTAG